jgi:hypothetical protein
MGKKRGNLAKRNTERKAAKKIDKKAQTQAEREADLPAFVTVPPAKETGSGIRGIEAATAASPIPTSPAVAPANQTTSEGDRNSNSRAQLLRNLVHCQANQGEDHTVLPTQDVRAWFNRQLNVSLNELDSSWF